MTILARLLLLLLLPTTVFAKNIVNVYAWTGEIPDFVIRQFEQETGIKVNYSMYENNEIMYAKLSATPNTGYDIIMPSSNILDRMRKQNMLAPLDKSKLPNWKHVNPEFINRPYDPESRFSVPFIWGVTGIFVNNAYFPEQSISHWNDLWRPEYANHLLLLDDARDTFSAALISLGYNVNESNPEHIQQAFNKLKSLMKNVKVFSTDTVVSIMIDEDATIGTAWNGDTFKAWQENHNIRFVYPKEGFCAWIDSFAIPIDAPHKNEAHAFINFILRPDIAKKIALFNGYPTANLTGQALLPADIRNNKTVYPPAAVLKHSQFQLDLSNETLALYEKYWEELKMST